MFKVIWSITKSKSALIAFLYSLTFSLYIEIPNSIKVSHIIFPLVVMILLYFIINGRLRINKNHFALISFGLIGFLFLLIKLALTDPIFFRPDVFNVIIMLLFSIGLLKVRDKDLSLLINCTVYLSILIISIETSYRISNPKIGSSMPEARTLDFFDNLHAFKTNSLMYSTSNGTAYHLLVILAMVLFVYRYKINVNANWLAQTLIVILITLTFSRASYICAIVLYLIRFVLMWQKEHKILMAGAIALLIFPLAIKFLGEIGTLSTKFEILNNIIAYLSNASFFNLLFGNAYTPPSVAYSFFDGYVGHTHYFDLIYYLGFIGTIFYLFVFVIPYCWKGILGAVFVILFLLIGLSNIRIFSHFMLLSFALSHRLYLLNKKY